MTIEEAMVVIRRWPEDKEAPRLLKEGINASKGKRREQLGQMVEALHAASLTREDADLIKDVFG